jgi:hypothetical protein
MTFSRICKRAVALAALTAAVALTSFAPISGPASAADPRDIPYNERADPPGLRRWGFGVYSGPGVGYYVNGKYRPSYRVYDYRFYPAYRVYDYRDVRDLRAHARRWEREGFPYPLNRR